MEVIKHDLDVLRQQQLVLIEKQGDHGARISALEERHSQIHHDLREIRDLIRSSNNVPSVDHSALAQQRFMDMIERRFPPPSESNRPPTFLIFFALIGAAALAIGGANLIGIL